jgi:hypothetical protein
MSGDDLAFIIWLKIIESYMDEVNDEDSMKHNREVVGVDSEKGTVFAHPLRRRSLLTR